MNVSNTSPGLTPAVLVAVDFSPSSAAAALQAIRLADAFDLRLVFLHVVHDPAQAPGFYLQQEHAESEDQAAADEPEAKAVRKLRKGLRTHTRTMTAAADDMLGANIAELQRKHPESAALSGSGQRLVVGTPARRIVEIAEAENATHIVMGTRGRGALKGILLGSTAQRVVQLAEVPVTLVKAPHGGASRPEP